MTKTYTVESSSVNVTGGRYKSKSPSSAARKAATKLFKKAKGKSVAKITFCLRESTSGSDKKEFHYVANRVKLTKPLVRVINGVEIVNRYKTVVKAAKAAKATKAAKAAKATKAAKAAKAAKSSSKSSTSKPKSRVAKRGKKVKGGDCGCDK
jgi:hypothetical protein